MSLQDFSLEAQRPEIEAIIADNTFMAELQSRIVPLIVEYNVFWTRYFYRLHLLREKHSQRQQLAQRAQQVRASCAVQLYRAQRKGIVSADHTCCAMMNDLEVARCSQNGPDGEKIVHVLNMC